MRIKSLLSRVLWPHFVLGLMIAMEVALIVLGMRFVMPACRRILSYADGDGRGFYASTPWVSTFLGVLHVAAYNVTLWAVVFAVAWGLFRRYIPGGAKPAVRLLVLASLATVLFA